MSTNYTPTTVSGDNTETAINQNFSDIQDALENSVSRNAGDTHGSNAMQTDIDANGKTVMNLRFAQNDTEAVPLAQFNDVLGDFGIDSDLVARIEDSVAAIEAATAGNTTALVNHKWDTASSNVPLTDYIDPTQFFPLGLTPTFVSNNSFTVPEDQTGSGKLAVGKRLKVVHNTGATTEYKDITAVAYQAGPDNTLVTVNGTSLVSTVTSVAIGPGSTNFNLNASLIRDNANDQPLPTTLASLSSRIDFFEDEGAAVSSSDTTDLDTATGHVVHITGTTTITAITLSQGKLVRAVFDDVLTLTNSANLILPTAMDITTAAGDVAWFFGEGSSVTRCIGYQLFSGAALGGLTEADIAALGFSKKTLMTEQAATSGTSKDFTGIPTGVKRIVVMFDGVSTSGTSPIMVQLGDAGGPETSGYNGATTRIGAGTTAHSAGFLCDQTVVASANLRYGKLTLELEDSTNNVWAADVSLANSNPTYNIGAGTKALTGVLDRVRITTVGGTDTFDAGAINVMYET